MSIREWDKIIAERGWGRWPDTRLVEWIMRTVPTEDRPQTTVLELGCGAGAQLRFLAAEGFQAYGVDGSPAAVAQAKRLTGGFPVVWCADLETFEQPDESFDVIVDVCCLQHIPAGPNAQVIQKARRWLKPGGWIFSKWRQERYGIAGIAEPQVPEATGVPAPYPLSEGSIPHVFPGFERHVMVERLWYESGEATAHWIITGRKV